jgi:hypothetical protein
MLGASLLAFIAVRVYTRLQRRYKWRSSRIGGVHLHHLVAGVVIVLSAGMVDIALDPGDEARGILAIAFGIGGAFILDEFALTFHLRDVYWTEEGRRSIDACIMWLLLGLLLLVGISPFGIHDKTFVPRSIGFAAIAISIVLSLVTCLKGKLTLGLVSIFVPPVGLFTATRLARPGSLWSEVFYRRDLAKLERAEARFCPERSRVERLRIKAVDLVAGSHDGP